MKFELCKTINRLAKQGLGNENCNFQNKKYNFDKFDF